MNKKVIAIFEIPDDETIDNTVVSKLTHCRQTSTGADAICSTPIMKFIEDEYIVKRFIGENNITF